MTRDRHSHACAGRLRCLLPPHPLAPTGRCTYLRLVACLLMSLSTRGTLSDKHSTVKMIEHCLDVRLVESSQV